MNFHGQCLVLRLSIVHINPPYFKFYFAASRQFSAFCHLKLTNKIKQNRTTLFLVSYSCKIKEFTMSKLVFCKNYVLSFLRVAPDGNCLFSSLAHQIFGGRRDINGVLPSIFLRHKIIDYLWANLGQYTPCLVAESFTVESALHLVNPSCEITRSAAYLNYLRQDGTYGGSESISSVVHIYQRQQHSLQSSLIQSAHFSHFAPVLVVFHMKRKSKSRNESKR